MERPSSWNRSKLGKIHPDLHVYIVLVQVIVVVAYCQQQEDVILQLQARTPCIEIA